MAKPKKRKLELISITYKVDGKIHSKAIESKKNVSKLSKKKPMLDAHADAVTNNDCGEGCRCVNGKMEILVCFGGDCVWESTGLPCPE